MRLSQNPVLLFGVAQLLGAAGLAAFFWRQPAPLVWGISLWLALPAFIFAGALLAAQIVMRMTSPPSFGFWKGVVSGLLGLIGAGTLVNPQLLAGLVLTWGVALLPLAGVIGWLLGRQLKATFSPDPFA